MTEDEFRTVLRSSPVDSPPGVVPGGSTVACWDCDCIHATAMMRELGLNRETLCEFRDETPDRLHVWVRGKEPLKGGGKKCHVCGKATALDLRAGPLYTIVPGVNRKKCTESPMRLFEVTEVEVQKAQRLFTATTRLANVATTWGWRHGQGACHRYALGMACVLYFAGVEEGWARLITNLVLRHLGDVDDRSKDVESTYKRAAAGEDVSRQGITEEQRDEIRRILAETQFGKAPVAVEPSAIPPPPSEPPAPGAPADERPVYYARSDMGNALFFVDHFKDLTRYDHQRRAWFIWMKNWWWEDPAGIIYEYAKEAIRERYKWAEKVEKADERKAQVSFAQESQSKGKIEAMIALAQSDERIADKGSDWDKNEWLLGVGNGVVDLRSGQLLEGDPSQRLTMHTDVDFDPEAKAPRWEQFVNEVFCNDQELIVFIQKTLGYSITGSTLEQVWFLCWGAGSNGKSTLLRVLRHVLGGYCYTIPFTTLEVQTASQIPSDLASMMGKRFVTAVESSEGSKLNEAKIKVLTGTDPISARHLYGRWFEFQPVGKLWLATNHRPRVRDDSHAFWRRVRLIPFNARFEGANVDRDLDQKLKAEASGILAWLVTGCLRWQKEGLVAPPVVMAATQEYREDSDPIAEFLEEKCLFGEGEVAASHLVQAYHGWCDERKLPEKERLTTALFGRRMHDRFPRKRTARGRVYLGLRLKEQGSLKDVGQKSGADPPGAEDSEEERFTLSEHMSIFKSIIRGLDDNGHGAPREYVVIEATNRGLPKERIDFLIQKLQEDGRIYESEPGHFKVT